MTVARNEGYKLQNLRQTYLIVKIALHHQKYENQGEVKASEHKTGKMEGLQAATGSLIHTRMIKKKSWKGT